jgi:hypothetical protein
VLYRGGRIIERFRLMPDGKPQAFQDTVYEYVVAFTTGFNGPFATPRYSIDGIEFSAMWQRLTAHEGQDAALFTSQIAALANQFTVRNATSIEAWKKAQKKGKRK